MVELSGRFSIIVTCHNQQEFIRAAVDSVLEQTGSCKEIIVVDDGSDDDSLELLEQYGQSIRLVSFRKNQGAISARNHGASMASGKYLVFLDGDDALTPWALDVYEKIVSECSPKIILGKSFWFRGVFPESGRDDVPRQIEFVQYEALMQKDRPAGLSASTYVVDRKAFWAVGGWTPGIFHLDCQDLSTKLGYEGRSVLICQPYTAYYRIHSANSIHSVAPFLAMALCLLSRERSGLYPGSRQRRFERHAWLGGFLIFWVGRAVAAGHHKEALRLIASGWPMMVAAVCRRATIRLTGRRPIKTVQLLVETTPANPCLEIESTHE